MRFGHTKHFAEINSVDQGCFVRIHVYMTKHFASLIFTVWGQSAENTKIIRLENLALYGSLGLGMGLALGMGMGLLAGALSVHDVLGLRLAQCVCVGG